MKSFPIQLFLVLFFVIELSSTSYAKIIFVDKNASGSQTGLTWASAFKKFQDGLDDSNPADKIYVAKGTYLPTTMHGGNNPENLTFQMKNEVEIYGGFDPGAGIVNFEDRDPDINETVLNGDIGYPDWDGDNVYHVFYHPSSLDLDDTAVLDGFTISNGFARSTENKGGGMYNNEASPTIRNCTFKNNKASFGAGMSNNFYSSPVVSHTKFVNNTATSNAGGMFNFAESNPRVDACAFIGNQATNTYSDGGGMRNFDSVPVVTNSLFLYNKAGNGGGVLNSAGLDDSIAPIFINCTFYGNVAVNDGGGIYNHLLPAIVANCIIWGNIPNSIYDFSGISTPDIKISFSDVQMPEGQKFPGLDNINADPKFMNIPSFIDFTIKDGAVDVLVVVDSSLYSQDDRIEIEHDGITRVVLSIDEHEVEFKPPLASATTPGMHIKNWGKTIYMTEDFHLLKSSPCIDTGTHLVKGLPVEDFEYEDRAIDGDGDAVETVDMGMDEFNPFSIIYVDQDATGADNGASWSSAFNDLQDALDMATDGYQIWVAEGIYKPSKRIIALDARTATYQLKNNVTLYGGFNPSNGDDDFSERDVSFNQTILSGDLGVSGSTTDNSYHVFYHPAMLAALNTTAILDGFYIQDGNANDGGIIDINLRGGGMYNNASSPTIRNCFFRNNHASLGSGMYNENASTVINNNTFSDNQATQGGGIYNINSTLSITNCRFGSDSFEGNWASGGGVYNAQGSDITITDCLFQDNSGQNGAGLYCDNAVTIVTRSDFLFNKCETNVSGAGRGGGIYMFNSQVTLDDLSISNNTAYNFGGGMYCVKGLPVIHDVSITDNMSQNGGGLYLENCAGRIDGASSILNNRLINSENGGGVYLCNGASTEFDSVVIDGNDARNNDSYGGGIYCDDASPQFNTCDITNNSSDGFGGGIAIFNNSSPVFEGCTIDLNTAVLDGGGIYIDGSDPDFITCSISSNSATSLINSRGGGIACFGGSPVLTGCTIEANQASVVGGGMLIDADSGPAAPVLTGCTFTANIVSSTTVGHASGGGIYNANGGFPVLESCTFTGNQAHGSYSFTGGGAIYNDRSSASILDCIFTSNTANEDGGAIYHLISGQLTIDNTDFTNNEAENGGAICNLSSDPVKVTGSDFTGNRANEKGGGFYGASNSSGSFFNFCFFESNGARSGGGMFLSNSNIWVVNNQFINNTAIGGGGLSIKNQDEQVFITGSIFKENLATSGAALYIENASPEIGNCTLVDNNLADGLLANGSVIFNVNATPAVNNSIIWGNDSPYFYNNAASSLTIIWSDIQGGYGSFSDNNLKVNPMLDTDARLMNGSPVIDQGNNALVISDETDIDDDSDTIEPLPLDVFNGPRIIDNGVRAIDMGADEFEFNVVDPDIDQDGDVDGKDLYLYSIDLSQMGISIFAGAFGRVD
ncbi:MAG: hypothetical protein GY699_22605 [Desulfobacteraceae bacterium]|nr:hypothetical protein [Desulfobacteraceae bacterium]